MTRAYYNEVDSHAAEWLRNLIAAKLITAGEVDARSILDVRPGDLAGFTRCHFFAGIGVWDYALGLAGWPAKRPVWTGSCPCQPFSAAGGRGGFADQRHLWPAFFHLIRECRPATVLGEQVASKDGLGWLDLVQADLEGEGYAVGAADLCAASVGAPHIRQRLWFVADANGNRLQGPESAHAPAGGRRPADAGGSPRIMGNAGRQHDEYVSRSLSGSQGEIGRRSDHRPGGAGADGVMGDTGGARGGRHAGAVSGTEGQGSGERGRVGRQPHESVASGAACNFWSDADWVPCRDGKARPVEPGTEPLVDGAAFRLGSGSAYEGRSRAGMLKGYGNAINAQRARGFIEAVMDCQPTAEPFAASSSLMAAE